MPLLVLDVSIYFTSLILLVHRSDSRIVLTDVFAEMTVKYLRPFTLDHNYLVPNQPKISLIQVIPVKNCFLKLCATHHVVFATPHTTTYPSLLFSPDLSSTCGQLELFSAIVARSLPRISM